jgi:hypothetical protein
MTIDDFFSNAYSVSLSEESDSGFGRDSVAVQVTHVPVPLARWGVGYYANGIKLGSEI